MWMLNIKVNKVWICLFDWIGFYLRDLYYMKKGFSNIKSCVNIYEVINLELYADKKKNLELYVNHSLSCVLSKSICVTINISLLHS